MTRLELSPPPVNATGQPSPLCRAEPSAGVKICRQWVAALLALLLALAAFEPASADCPGITPAVLGVSADGSQVVIISQPSGAENLVNVWYEVNRGIFSTTFPTAPGSYRLCSATPQCAARGVATGWFSESNVVTINTPVCATISPTGIIATLITGNYAEKWASATGGSAPYTYTASGTLPPGMTMGSGGQLYGTPTTAGTYSFTISIRDARNCPSSVSGWVNVLSPCPTITASLTNTSGTVGQHFSTRMVASGGRAPYFFTATGMPPGLLGTSLGGIEGTPTAVGTSRMTIYVSDADGCTGYGYVDIVIGSACPWVGLNMAQLPEARIGTFYSVTLAPYGGAAPYTVTMTPFAGLSYDSATHTISGVPTGTPGTQVGASYTIRDANGCPGSGSFYVVLRPACAVTLTTNPNPLPRGTVGRPYSASLVASGGSLPYTYSVSRGVLPAGLTLSADGRISGTPTVRASTSTTVQVTDASGCGTSMVITIGVDCDTLTVTPSGSISALVGAAIRPMLYAVTGGTGTITWSAPAGNLPPGITFDTATAILSGTPTIAGSYTFSVTATDSAGCTGSANCTFNIACPSITVSPTSLASGFVGQFYAQATGFSASGGSAPYNFTAPAPLPAGMSWDAVNNKITGTPSAGGTTTMVVRVQDAHGCSGNATVVFTVDSCPALSVTQGALSATQLGTFYSSQLTAAGGVAPYTFSVSSGVLLPAGLSLSSAGVISGTTSIAGSYSFTVSVRDSRGCTGWGHLSLVVNLPTCPTITVSPGSTNPTALANGKVGTAISQQFTASSSLSSGFTYSLVNSNLPATLSLSSAGLLSGTPTAAGSYSFTVRATMTAANYTTCNGSRSYTLTIDPVALSLGDYVFYDVNLNGLQDDARPISGATVQLYKADGVTPATNNTGASVPTQTTGGDGKYLFTNLLPGDYVVCVIPPAGYSFISAGSDPDDNNNADSNTQGANATGQYCSLPVTLSVGGEPTNDGDSDPNTNLTVDFGFCYSGKPNTWLQWQHQNLLEGQNAPNLNPDGDRYDNLLEYATCRLPDSGLQEQGGFCLVATGANSLDAIIVRRAGSQTDIIYTVQAIKDLALSPTGWQTLNIVPTITTNGDGTETVRFANVQNSSLFSGSDCGFVRLKVGLDADQNGTPEATSVSETSGFCNRSLPNQCVSFSHPFLNRDVFTGTVGSIFGGNTLNIANSIGANGNFRSKLVAGVEYFVEVHFGGAEGQRYEVNEAASTATTIAIDLSHARNTHTVVYTSIINCPVSVRPHITYGQAFPVAGFTGTNSPSTADKAIEFVAATQSFRNIWLWANSGSPQWTDGSSATLQSQNNRVIDNGQGLYIHPRNGGCLLTSFGLVRDNKFARPMLIGNNMVGGGFPMNQSPNNRSMTNQSGYVGSNSQATADKITLWQGDITAGSTSYSSYYYVVTASLNKWISLADATLASVSDTKLFANSRAAFVKVTSARPSVVMPRGWNP